MKRAPHITSWIASAALCGAMACGGDPEVSPTGGGSNGNGNGSGSGAGGTTGGGMGGGFVVMMPTGGTTKPPANAPTTMNNCGLNKVDLQRQPAELLLVLDRSGSMVESARDPSGQVFQKWNTVTMALDQVVNRTQASVFWGLKLYPMPNACGVQPGVNVPVAVNNHAMVAGAIRANPAVQNGGATPTQGAVRNATQFLQQRQSPNPKYILLATDGLPNCRGGNTDRRAVDGPGAVAAVADAAKAGFPTFVIGVATAGSDAHSTLNEMAVAGGRPRNDPGTRYFPAQSASDLATALEAITGQIASCTFPLKDPPPVPENVAVEVDGMRVGKDAAQGWSYGMNNRSVVINGALCDKLKSGAAKSVQIIFGCPGMVIP